jgi:hypothetical protein
MRLARPPSACSCSRLAARLANLLCSLLSVWQVLVTAHWYACAIALQATLHSSPLNTYLGAYNFCAEDNPFTRARSLREHDDFARMRSLRELSIDPTSPTYPTDPTDPTGASARRGLSPIPGCITHLNALSWYVPPPHAHAITRNLDAISMRSRCDLDGRTPMAPVLTWHGVLEMACVTWLA